MTSRAVNSEQVRPSVYCQLCGNFASTAVEVVTYRTADGAEVAGVLTRCERSGCASESVMLPLAATISAMAGRAQVTS